MSTAKILVVEDEPAISELIVSTLTVAGFDTVQAFDTSSAYMHIIDDRPDLILLDWMMSYGESGIDLTRKLKKRPRHAGHSHHHLDRQRRRK